MILCGEGCVPCCDFCIYEIPETWEEDGRTIKGGPIGCALHSDAEHQRIAEACKECDDFHCFLAGDKNGEGKT